MIILAFFSPTYPAFDIRIAKSIPRVMQQRPPLKEKFVEITESLFQVTVIYSNSSCTALLNDRILGW